MAISRKGLSDKLDLFLAAHSFHNDAEDNSSAQLVMLRGCKVNSDGSLSAEGSPLVYTDHYDDVLVVFGKKARGAAYLETFKASAKPGLAWIHHPSYAGVGSGCPTVQPGQYRYQRGDHKGHEAMRQCAASPVVVIRDLDDDAKLEATDRVDYPEYTGINIHAGGAGAKVGLNSSGCQVIWGGWEGAPWRLLHSLVYKVAAPQKVFHYTLVDFMHFAAWHDGLGSSSKLRMLLFGSRGPDVATLQGRLAEAGYFAPNLIDGVFGRGTDRAVRAWQKKWKLPVNGIIRLSEVA